jgi:hypothetical protein
VDAPCGEPDAAADAFTAAQRLAVQEKLPLESSALLADPDQYGDLYYAVRLPAGVDPGTAAQMGFITRDLAGPGEEEPVMSLNLAATPIG